MSKVQAIVGAAVIPAVLVVVFGFIVLASGMDDHVMTAGEVQAQCQAQHRVYQPVPYAAGYCTNEYAW